MGTESRTAGGSIDRRALITKAAAAAGAGWTAPVVLGSLHTPAAAVTGCPDCTGSYRARFEGDFSRTDANGGGCVVTNQWNATANYPAEVTVADSASDVVFTIGEPGCSFDGAASNFGPSRVRCDQPGNTCAFGSPSPDGQTITFTKSDCTSGEFLFYQLAIVCS